MYQFVQIKPVLQSCCNFKGPVLYTVFLYMFGLFDRSYWLGVSQQRQGNVLLLLQ